MIDTPMPPMNPEVARLRRLSAQRKLKKRLRQVRLLWSIAGVLLFCLMLEVLVALCFSPRLWVYRIAVKNCETLSTGEIIRLIHLPAGSNHFRVSLGQLAERVAREPRVATATIKHGAIGTLIVSIQERQAVFQVGYASPPLYVDAQGVVFTRPLPPVTPVPTVEGILLRAPKDILGKQLTDTQATAVLACLAELKKSMGDRLDIARATVDAQGAINLILRQGTQIFIGAPIDLPLKAWWLNKTIVQASNEGHSLEQLDYINLRFVNEDSNMGPSFHAKHDQVETIEP
jgi:cell division septal protein FtsQ